jgi:hypothetical protein
VSRRQPCPPRDPARESAQPVRDKNSPLTTKTVTPPTRPRTLLPIVFQGDVTMRLAYALAAIFLFNITVAAQGPRTIPNTTSEQAAAIARMNAALAPELQRVSRARTELVAAVLTLSGDGAALRSRLEGIRDAEIALAHARATAFAELQSSANRLPPDLRPRNRGYDQSVGSEYLAEEAQTSTRDYCVHDRCVMRGPCQSRSEVRCVVLA